MVCQKKMNSKPSGSEWGSNIGPQGAGQRMLLSQDLNVLPRSQVNPGKVKTILLPLSPPLPSGN